MRFYPPLEEARLIRRYKRFLADIETVSGELLTIHCPNTGSMLNCQVEGGQVAPTIRNANCPALGKLVKPRRVGCFA